MEKTFERLRKWLTDNDIKQVDFAQKLGSTQAYISAILSGKRNLGPNLIDRILQEYPEMDKSYLLYGGEDKEDDRESLLERIIELQTELMNEIKLNRELTAENVRLKMLVEKSDFKNNPKGAAELNH